MKPLGKPIASIFGLFFAIVLLGLTGYNTWLFLYEVSGNPIMATLGLIVFEGGMLHWLMAFKLKADGIWQMAISAIGFMAGLLLVLGSNGLHMGALDTEMFGSNTPARLVLIATMFNLASELFFGLADPAVTQHIYKRVMAGFVQIEALKMAMAKVQEHAQRIATPLADDIARNAEIELYTTNNVRHQLQQPFTIVEMPRNELEGQAHEVDPSVATMRRATVDETLEHSNGVGRNDFLAPQE